MYPAMNYARTLDDAAQSVIEIAEALVKVDGDHRRVQPLRRLPWSLLEDLDAPRSSDVFVRSYHDFVDSFGRHPSAAVAALLAALAERVARFKVIATTMLTEAQL